jgi:predicted NBD/HSP70 family sugar kinase
MNHQRNDQDQGARNRNRVIAEILRTPGLSRTDIGNAVGLNMASVSRITRDLIDAGLIHETDAFGVKGRPGRRFVGLRMNGDGGYVIGIGINAFRQSVTLADLENRKVAEWVAEEAPGKDAEAFLRLCLDRAEDMVRTHIPDRSRFFGVGMAIAATLNNDRGEILCAPIFGWNSPIALRDMVLEVLDAPLVMDTPPSSINKAEADHGLGKGVINLTTLYCSLGFGIGVRKLSDDGGSIQEFGRVMTENLAPDGSGRSLSDVCGGRSLLAVTRGADVLSAQSGAALSLMLIDDINRAAQDESLQRVLYDCGKCTAEHFSLVLDLCQPERLMLAGPLSRSGDYVSGFKRALSRTVTGSVSTPEVRCSDMTPTGASRWLALHENVAMGNLNLAALKQETAA